MKKLIKRKEFENLFLPILKSGKNIWTIHRVKELPIEIVNMAIRLSTLEFINHIRLADDSISASSEIEGKRIKVPITRTNHLTAIGIKLLFDINYKVIDFDEINSPIKGNGSKMVDAILSDFPEGWRTAVVMDWSDGFWDKMKDKYEHIEWIM
jgi:hypothetical protein